MIGRMIGAARLNVATFEEVEQDKGATIQALAVVILVSIASFVGGIFGADEVDIVRGLVIGVASGIASWFLWALVTWMVGSTILATSETKANWGELARCTGFAQTPGIFSVLIIIPVVGGVLWWVAFFWKWAAMMVAVRQALDYTSTWRAFFVILIAAIPVLIMNGIIFVIFLIISGEDITEPAEQALRMLGIGSFAAA